MKVIGVTFNNGESIEEDTELGLMLEVTENGVLVSLTYTGTLHPWHTIKRVNYLRSAITSRETEPGLF